jgi:hypothetical protein
VKKPKQWTEEETSTLRQMKADGYTNTQIGFHLGKLRANVADRWRWLNMTAEAREQKQRASNEARRQRNTERGHAPSIRIRYTVAAPEAPPDILVEREKRQAAPRTLTAILFGDPPTGFSALDRKSVTPATPSQVRRRPTLAWQPISFE